MKVRLERTRKKAKLCREKKTYNSRPKHFFAALERPLDFIAHWIRYSRSSLMMRSLFTGYFDSAFLGRDEKSIKFTLVGMIPGTSAPYQEIGFTIPNTAPQ